MPQTPHVRTFKIEATSAKMVNWVKQQLGLNQTVLCVTKLTHALKNAQYEKWTQNGKNQRTFVVEAYPTAARNAPVGCNAGTVEGPLLRLMRMPCLQLR